jgi:hypothetical protein
MSSLDLVHDGLLTLSSQAIRNTAPHFYLCFHITIKNLRSLFLIIPLENNTLMQKHVAVGI